MKYHRILVEAVITGIRQVMYHESYADKVLQKLFFENKKWGARDRAFVAESFYDIIRHYRLYEFVSGQANNTNVIVAVYFQKKYGNLPEWIQLTEEDHALIQRQWERSKEIRAIRESIPDWMDEMCESEIGENWDREIAALNEEAKVVLRANTLKCSIDQLQDALNKQGIESHRDPLYPTALILEKRMNVFRLEEFKKGWFELQDASSQLVAPFLDLKPGMRAVDACAGAGGKSLHMAAILKNKGQLICLDTESWKLDELRKRASRNGVDLIQIKIIEDQKTIKRLYKTADRLLLDVPCSGLGVLRRNPDAKWKLSPEFMDEVIETQSDILEKYHKILKPGGKMVYATCSILPAENQEQVARFLKAHPEFTLEEEKIISPADSGFDGFYMGRISFKL